MPTYLFHVLLLDAKGRPFPGLIVQIFEKDPTAPGPLEQGFAGPDGRISFSITANRFKNPAAIPGVFFKVLQDGKEIHQSGIYTVANIQGEEQHVTLTVPVELPGVKPVDTPPLVFGRLEGPAGEPLPGVKIEAYHQDKCETFALGDTQTDATGYYKIEYRESWRQSFPWLNLYVRAFVTEEFATWITSPIVANARPVEEINLAAGGGAYRGPSRFTTLQETLAPVAQCWDIRTMPAEMIAVMARESGVECTEVVHFFGALALKEDTGAEPELFYAFQKAGLSPQLAELIQQDKNTLVNALTGAAKENLIPFGLAGRAGELVQALRGTPVWTGLDKSSGEAFAKHFHRKLGDPASLGPAEQTHLHNKLSRHFNHLICQALGADDPVTLYAVAALKLDPLALKDHDFMTIVRENVLAPLQQSNLLSGCNRKILVSAESLTSDGRTVGEVLGLDQTLKTHPAFHREALRVKVRALAGLAGLSPAATGQLTDENLYLELLPDTEWDELVQKGVLNAEQKFGLQKLYTFGKLTDFHFDLVKVLRDDPRAKTGKDLASLTAGDWTALLEKVGNSTPNGETPAVYIKNIMAAVEASYPSPAFCATTLKRGFIKLDTPLQALKPLLEKNENLLTGNAIDWSGVPEKDRPTVEQNLKTIRAFANAYRHLGVPEILESRQSVQAKGQAVQDAVRAVQRLVDKNPDMDIRTANFIKKSTAAKPGEVNWSTVPAEFRDKVQRQMLAFQRVRNLAPDTTQATALLDMGADSAHKITAMPKNRFVQESGLEPAAAETIYANAQHAATVAMHHLQAAREVFQNQLMGLPVDNTIEHAHRGYLLDKNLQSGECEGPVYSHGNSLYSQLRNELLHVSGFEDLFGPQNFCQCDHCKSVLSPAAYFVDMMYWIEKHITAYSSAETALLQQHCENKFTDHPLWLHNRRPDLWDLKVTCENTYELVPYLQIVNEVMEAYIKKLTGWTDIYQELLKPANQISFYSPRSLPFYEILILLEHFDVNLSDIAKANRANAGVQEMALLEAQLEELNYTGSIFQKFGNKTTFDKMKVSEFLKHTIIGRRELDALLATNYIKKNQNIKIEKKAFDPSIQYYEEELVNLTSEALLRIHFFLKLRGKTRWSIPELDLVFSTLDALLGPPAQGANPYQPNQISAIVALLKLQKYLGVGLEELVGIVHQLPNVSLESVEKKDPLTQELFQEKKPGYLTRKFRLDKMLAPVNLAMDKDTEPFAFFLAGLNISRDEFEAMQTWQPAGTPLFSAPTLLLDKQASAEISLYFRHICLAKSLKLSLPEWEKVLRLTQLLPDSISNTLALVERAMEFKGSPFTLDELLLLTDASGNTPLADKDIFVAELHKQEYPSFTGEILRPIKSSVFTDAKISALLTKWEKDGLITPAEDKEAYRLTTKFNWKALQQSTGLIVSWQTHGNGIKEALNPYHYMEPVAGLYVEQKKLIEIGNLEGNDLRILLPKLAAHIASVPGLGYSRFRVLDSYKTSELSKTIESLPTDTSESQARKQRLTDSMASIDQVLSAAMLKPQYLKVWTAFTGLNSEQAEALLPMVENDWLANYLSNFCQETVDGVPKGFEALWRQMQRLKLVVEKLQLTAADLRLLAQNHVGIFGISDIKSSMLLTLPNLAILEEYSRWKMLDPEAVDTVLLPALSNVQADKASVQAAFLHYFDIPSPVTGSVFFGFSAGQSNLDALQMLRDKALLCHRLGLSGTQLTRFITLTYAEAKGISAALSVSFQTQYDTQEAFGKAFDPYQERLNELKCELLRDYILARVKDVNFQTTNDLYAYFLLDTEMGGCLKISRIVAAHMSIQLYVHRVLMRLEQSENGRFNAVLDPDAADEWPWRKNYRVWEANRKVFLYPENYLEPEWRDNKSPEFKQLEEELLQQKISIESAEGAYKEYLKKFSEVGRLVIAGAIFNENNGVPTHYIFGRTVSDPYIYYYRKMKMVGVGTKDVGYDWSPWQKIDLSISSPEVTAVIHRNKIYIFWADILSEELSGFSNGNSDFQGTRHKITLLYSCLNENGKWLQPQRVDFHDYEGKMDNYSGYQNEIDRLMHDGVIPSLGSAYERKYKTRDRYQKSRFFKKLYVEPDERYPERLSISYIREYLSSQQVINFDNITRSLNLSTKTLTNKSFNPKYHFYINVSKFQDVDNAKTYRRLSKSYTGLNTPYVLDYFHDKPGFGIQQWTLFDIENLKYADCLLVSNSFLQENKWLSNDLIIKLDDEYLLLHKKFGAPPGYKYALVKLNTNVVESLQEYLFAGGVEGFTSIETQRLSDNQIPAVERDFSEMEKPPHDRLNFFGAHGLYFWELFFHIPSLIADHLNAEGKYKDADWWYRRIFNPMAAKDDYLTNPVDRNWQFVPFRDRSYPKYSDMLTDGAALSVYNNDPFNPHAIARLRISAYAKATVLRYVDNLLDWADKLYRQDTFESNNEAMMLYILAQDILGERPREAGKCETAADSGVTYGDLRPSLKEGSEFLIWMENLPYVHASANTLPATNPASGYAQAQPYTPAAPAPAGGSTYQPRPAYVDNKVLGVTSAKNQKLVFCVPMNKEILDLWDRVEDRLFKLRHCMNIDGIRRTLSLFAPAIDPRMLIAARAAGLSLEEALALLDAPVPYYRFQYMLDKAKSFAGTVQSFGGALLSALEKKDVEELTLLRSVHEQNILSLTREIKRQQIEEAKTQLANLQESKKTVEIRKEYYAGLIEKGLIEWEVTQQVAKHTASVFMIAENIMKLSAAISALIPQAGSPPSMNYGGMQVSKNFFYAATAITSMAGLSEMVASSAGLEAGNQRREQEWKNQLKLAEQELKAMEKQIAAAEIRVLIAEKDLMVHDTQIEQAKELHEFYKSKFSNLGLYRYMATTLNRLYSQAYNLAYDMAKKAEKCYQFETEDATTFFIQGDNWDSGYAGLLAGERLLLQLQRMEKSFIEQTPRRDEIRQSFSVRMVNPAALITLRETGQCEFTIPEAAFDISYPGHYKRRIKSVSVTVPAVVGPYTNVPARLTLESSQIRTLPSLNTDMYSGPNFAHTSIAASSANNDGGQFELSFQDVRYLPFEGGGAANSKWTLVLPDAVRPFDYNTISDVIVHINYTALYDSGLRTAVENGLKTAINDLKLDNNGSTEPFLKRVVSVKQEFPDVWHLIQNDNVKKATLEIKSNWFPYFAQEGTLGTVKFLKGMDNNTGKLDWETTDVIPSTPPSKLEGSLVLFKDADPLDKHKPYVFMDDIILLLYYKV